MRPRLGIDVDAPGDRAWEQLVDLRCWPGWGPSVREARLTDGSRVLSAGARGAVRTPVGVWLPFRVEQWHEDEARRSWAWRVAGAPATEHTVLDRGPGRCRVEMSVPWWGAPYLGVVALALRRIRHLTTT